MRRIDGRELVLPLAVGVASLAAASLAVALLQAYVGVLNASAVYLAAVVATAIVGGTFGAVIAAVASFLLYDFLFVLPLYTFTVEDPAEWMNLVLLLFVGLVVGQLVALQRSRTEMARAREREARALVKVSGALARRESIPAVLPAVAVTLRDECRMERVWIALGPDDAGERVAADTDSGPRPTSAALNLVLRRGPDDATADWVRVHSPALAHARGEPAGLRHRVRIEAGGATLGSIWALRRRDRGEPDRTETRLLSAVADQVGQALVQERLAADAQAAEIARQSDALKSALLQSVSHDLRTPLATIRAAAGTLRPGMGLSPEEEQESADAIDREVDYLNRMVTNLLDLSRIEAGALRAERDVFDLDDLLGRTLERLRARLGDRPLMVGLETAPAVEVDPVFLEEATTNALDNAVKHTPPGTPIQVVAHELAGEPYVRLTIEDGGPGVPDELLPRIFDKFYRVPGQARTSRSGTGIGLAVTQGLVEAMGGRVAARRSELGGLAIDLDLPMAPVAGDAAAAVGA
jgi:two-component system, OmpR family, sensor histidine kinase KdpD